LVTVTVKAATADTVGVPLMRPVDAFKVSPAGSAPLATAHVSGVLPDAVRFCE
jgi:hypothetical protein